MNITKKRSRLNYNWKKSISNIYSGVLLTHITFFARVPTTLSHIRNNKEIETKKIRVENDIYEITLPLHSISLAYVKFSTHVDPSVPLWHSARGKIQIAKPFFIKLDVLIYHSLVTRDNRPGLLPISRKW